MINILTDTLKLEFGIPLNIHKKSTMVHPYQIVIKMHLQWPGKQSVTKEQSQSMYLSGIGR